MKTAVFGSLVAAALALALAFRAVGLDLRPMHHDEANQAVKFGQLLEAGEYTYDPHDHHGPTLYYFTLPSAWLRGQASLAALDERTLRLVPAFFGAGLILLLPLLSVGLGRGAVAAGACLAALSPALTYYSRFYIQETLFVFLAMGFLISLGRFLRRPGYRWAVAAGVFAGLAYSTKETSIIVIAAAVAAAALARVSTRRGETRPHVALAPVAVGCAVALLVAFVFFSSFFRHPEGLVESLRAFGTYIGRGVDPGRHAHPWYFYLGLLTFSSSGGVVWSEGLVLGLAMAGLVAACRPSKAGFWPRYVALYAVLTAVAFSAVRYKTPWNLLPFYAGFVVLAGYGAAALVELVRPRAARALLVLVLAAAACHLGVQNWRASVRYPADPRNPYVYAQTTPDFLRLVRRVTDLAAVHADRTSMFVKVIAGPYEQWPLPWYLRGLKRVGYWARTADAGTAGEAPVIVASQENVPALDAALGDRYVSEFYGLRPGVLLTVYVERTLWEQFLGVTS